MIGGPVDPCKRKRRKGTGLIDPRKRVPRRRAANAAALAPVLEQIAELIANVV